MPTLGELERQLKDARKLAADSAAWHGRMSPEAMDARKHLNEVESRYTSELLACTPD